MSLVKAVIGESKTYCTASRAAASGGVSKSARTASQAMLAAASRSGAGFTVTRLSATTSR
jgi:hypothetical protein